MTLNNQPGKSRRRAREHSFQIWKYAIGVEEATRDRWDESSDLRRVVAALSTMPLDKKADRDLVRRIEGWAISEGRRLEAEDSEHGKPTFDGMIDRFFEAVGPDHLLRYIEALQQRLTNETE